MPDRGKSLPAGFDTTPTIEELADRQGVRPVEDFESILGPAHSGDEESVDDFLSLLREWRRENAGPAVE